MWAHFFTSLHLYHITVNFWYNWSKEVNTTFKCSINVILQLTKNNGKYDKLESKFNQSYAEGFNRLKRYREDDLTEITKRLRTKVESIDNDILENCNMVNRL